MHKFPSALMDLPVVWSFTYELQRSFHMIMYFSPKIPWWSSFKPFVCAIVGFHMVYFIREVLCYFLLCSLILWALWMSITSSSKTPQKFLHKYHLAIHLTMFLLYLLSVYFHIFIQLIDTRRLRYLFPCKSLDGIHWVLSWTILCVAHSFNTHECS